MRIPSIQGDMRTRSGIAVFVFLGVTASGILWLLDFTWLAIGLTLSVLTIATVGAVRRGLGRSSLPADREFSNAGLMGEGVLKGLGVLKYSELYWERPSLKRGFYELVAGGEVFAALDFGRTWLPTSRAKGRTAEGSWTFDKGGIFRVRVTVESEVDATVATVWPQLFGGASITSPTGLAVSLVLVPGQARRLQVMSQEGNLLLTMEIFDMTSGRLATVTFSPGAVSLPGLTYVILLIWYMYIVKATAIIYLGSR